MSNKSLKKVLSAVLAFSMVASVCTSCKDRDGNSSNGSKSTTTNNTARKIKNYFLATDLATDLQTRYIDSLSVSGENIYVKGYKDNNDEDCARKLAFYDCKTNEMKVLSMNNLEGVNYIQNIYSVNGKIYVCFTNEDYETLLGIYNEQTGTIENVVKGNDEMYFSSFFADVDGNLNAIMLEYSGMSVNSYIVKYNPETLEEIEKKPLSEMIEVPENHVVAYLLPDSQGNFYAFSANVYADEEDVCLYKLSSDFKVIYTYNDFSDMPGYMEGFFINKDGNICVASSDDCLYVNELSAQDGSVLNRYELVSDDLGIDYLSPDAVASSDKYDLIYCSEDGLVGYVLSEEKKEVIVPFGGEFDEAFSYSYYTSKSQDTIMMYTEDYGSGSGEVIYKLDLEGNIIDEISMEAEDDSYISNTVFGTDGKMYYLVETYDEAVSYRLVVTDTDGTEIFSTEIDGINGEDSYIRKMVVSDEGKAYILSCKYTEDTEEYTIYVVDAQGNLETTTDVKDNEYIDNIFFINDKIYISHSIKGHMVISELNMETGEIVEGADYDLPDVYFSNIMPGNDEYDFLYQTNDGIYGVDKKTQKSVELINWVDSDIEVEYSIVEVLDKDTMIGYGYDYKNGEYHVQKLQRVDEETLKNINNKTIITLAGENLQYSTIYDEIKSFNKESTEYRIQLNDYSKYSKYDEETDEYFSGASQLNTDIISGDIPDIIVGGNDLDLTAYASKGLLTDLNVYFENDGQLKREDYFESILDLCMYKGKLYQIPTDFYITGLVGKKSELGDEPGWTIEEFLDFADSKNGSSVFYEQTYETLLEMLVKNNLGQYVDFENNKCDFNSGSFERMLEFIKNDGVEKEEDKERIYDDDYYLESAKRFIENKCFVDNIHMYDFNTFLRMEAAEIGEEAVIKGYPSKEGSGAVISVDTMIGISEKSKCKDGAWKFVSSLISEEKQDAINEEYSNSFPILKSSFEKYFNMQKQETAEGNMTYTPDDQMVNVKPVDKETRDMVVNLIEDSPNMKIYDSRINKIIDEQFDIFINGGQSAKEAADAVQSKVSLYMKEIG